VNYLLLNGKKVCSVKLEQRIGRVRMGAKRSASFPKAIAFWSPVRPTPDHVYQLKLRGVGVLNLDIKTVFGRLAIGGYHVNAELHLPEESSYESHERAA
jgi:hypothetical protein